jgi:hypothetical protein
LGSTTIAANLSPSIPTEVLIPRAATTSPPLSIKALVRKPKSLIAHRFIGLPTGKSPASPQRPGSFRHEICANGWSVDPYDAGNH